MRVQVRKCDQRHAAMAKWFIFAATCPRAGPARFLKCACKQPFFGGAYGCLPQYPRGGNQQREGENMRKILIALPCLFVSGLAMAKDAPRTAQPKPAAAPASVAPAADSKRFDMTQGGKRMTADDFDAWMKKNGYRVATGKKGSEAPAAADGGKK